MSRPHVYQSLLIMLAAIILLGLFTDPSPTLESGLRPEVGICNHFSDRIENSAGFPNQVDTQVVELGHEALKFWLCAQAGWSLQSYRCVGDDHFNMAALFGCKEISSQGRKIEFSQVDDVPQSINKSTSRPK